MLGEPLARDDDLSAVLGHAVGMPASALLLDCGVVLKIGFDWEVEIRIESAFEVSGEDAPVTVRFSPCDPNADGPTGLTLLACVVGSHVVSAERRMSGDLVLTFDGDQVQMISVPGDDQYESWQFTYGNHIVTGMRY